MLVRKLHLNANMSMKDVHALRACKDKNKKLLKRHLVLFGVQVRVGKRGCDGPDELFLTRNSVQRNGQHHRSLQQWCLPLYGEQAGVKNDPVKGSRLVARGWCLDKCFITKEKCEILLVMMVVRIWTDWYGGLVRNLEAGRRSWRNGPWLGLKILLAIFPSRVCDCRLIIVIIIIIIIYCNWAFTRCQ